MKETIDIVEIKDHKDVNNWFFNEFQFKYQDKLKEIFDEYRNNTNKSKEYMNKVNKLYAYSIIEVLNYIDECSKQDAGSIYIDRLNKHRNVTIDKILKVHIRNNPEEYQSFIDELSKHLKR